MKNRLASNAFFQTLYQVVVTITPLLTTPYVSRVLGANGLGIYSYTLSVSSYFALFAMLGVATYGCRTIAALHGEKSKISKKFWEIYFFQMFCSLIMLLLYLVYIFFVCKENHLIALIQGVMIISCGFDINWFFFGIEKFKLTVTRNIIIKILSVASIFLFVRKEGGEVVYTIIMTLSTLLSQVIIWPFLKKEVEWIKPKLDEILSHIKPNIKLFIPVIAENVYHVMDKTMLGKLSNYDELGYYYNSDKMVNIPKGIINGLGTVFLVRMSAESQKSNLDSMRKLITKSFELHTFLASALAFGIGVISSDFIPLFFGSGFEKCILLMVYFCPILVIKTYSIFLETEYFLPTKKELYYTFSVVCGAITNVIFNVILIPIYDSIGAVISTLIAEFVVLMILFISFIVKSGLFDFKVWSKSTIYFVFGIIMFVCVKVSSNICLLLDVNIGIKIAIEIIIGGLTYLLQCIIYWKKTKSEVGGLIFNIIKKSSKGLKNI